MKGEERNIMIPNDQPLRKQVIERMINKLEEDTVAYDNMTKWEQNFVDSIGEQFREKGDLTNRQCEILERLYDR